jgi:hypothetical protein
MDFVFTDFGYLSINWINDGSNPTNPYPSGELIDLSHGEDRRCVWIWRVTDAIRTGLVFVKCRRCGANGQVIVTRAGSLKLPCNVSVFDPGAGAI